MTGLTVTRSSSANTRLWLAVAITVFFWASAFAAISVGLQSYSPGHLALLRFLSASGALLVYAVATRMRLPALHDLLAVLLGGFLGFTVYHVALNYGQLTVPAGTSSLLIATAPAMIALLATLFLGERLNRWGWGGIALSFAGVALIALGKERGFLTYAEINDHLPDEMVDAEQIEQFGVVQQLVDRPFHHIGLRRVEDVVLAGVDIDPHPGPVDQPPQLGETARELPLPVDGHHRMGSEGNRIGGDAEEADAVRDIPAQHQLQAIEICLDRGDKPLFRIGGQAKGPRGAARDAQIRTGVANLHAGRVAKRPLRTVWGSYRPSP